MKFYKLVEITEQEYEEKTGNLSYCTYAAQERECVGNAMYIAIDEEQDYGINIDIEDLEELQSNELLYTSTIELIKTIYKTYVCGGALHIVLDDENVEIGDIQWCIENAINQNFEQSYDADSKNDIEEDRLMFLKCAENLLKMSMEERLMCIRKALDYIA